MGQSAAKLLTYYVKMIKEEGSTHRRRLVLFYVNKIMLKVYAKPTRDGVY
jgi:hypothetical protein